MGMWGAVLNFPPWGRFQLCFSYVRIRRIAGRHGGTDTYVRIFYSERATSVGKNNHISPHSLPGVLRSCRLLGGCGLRGCDHSGRDVPRRARSGEIGLGPISLFRTLPAVSRGPEIRKSARTTKARKNAPQNDAHEKSTPSATHAVVGKKRETRKGRTSPKPDQSKRATINPTAHWCPFVNGKWQMANRIDIE